MEKLVGKSNDPVQAGLRTVRQVISECLGHFPVEGLPEDPFDFLNKGKMLRSLLALRVGPANGLTSAVLHPAAAATELIHAASLLHDDVIDGGVLRRGAPSFWARFGVPGAILTGDLLLIRAVRLIAPVNNGRFLTPLVNFASGVCEAEIEQEFTMRDTEVSWDEYLSAVRRKTGSLFAYLGHVCGGDDSALTAALTEAGYRLGTAYQMADDLWDARGDQATADKTLGTDQGRRKSTAMIAQAVGVNAADAVADLCRTAADGLKPWPRVWAAWNEYYSCDVAPVIEELMATRT